MGALFVYILKSSVCLAVFYWFYRMLLCKETFHRFNRFALLGLFFISSIIPCNEVRTKQTSEVQRTFQKWEKEFVPDVMKSQPVELSLHTNKVQAAHQWSWQEVVLMLYLLVLVFLFLRHVYSLVRIAFLLRKSKRTKIGNGITLVTHDSNLAPFSWMKYIVVSGADMKEDGEAIILHEYGHIRHFHSLDLILAEITVLFQWFNPAAWLFKQELQNIHEYEADKAVLDHGIDAKQYQLLLIKKAVGSVRFHSLANSFNHSTLKKRITMMLKRKSNPWARLKYIYILPLAVVAVAVFGRTEIAKEINQISEVRVDNLVSEVGTTVSERLFKNEVNVAPETVNTEQPADFLAVNDTIILRDTVFVTRRDTVILPSVSEKKPAKVSESVVRLKEFLDCHPYAWVVANQKEMRADEVRPEDYADIKGTIVYYPLDMSKRYGKRATGGVLLINTDEEFFKNVIVKNGSYEALSKAIKGDNFLILDGEHVFSDDFKLVDPCTIRSGAIESGKVYVSTDTGYWVKTFINRHPDALIVLHGKEIDAKDLSRRDYLSVRVISAFEGDESAKFGPKAKNGALFIGATPAL